MIAALQVAFSFINPIFEYKKKDKLLWLQTNGNFYIDRCAKYLDISIASLIEIMNNNMDQRHVDEWPELCNMHPIFEDSEWVIFMEFSKFIPKVVNLKTHPAKKLTIILILLIAAIFYPGETGRIKNRFANHLAYDYEVDNLGVLLMNEQTHWESKKIEEYLIGFLYPFGCLINEDINFADKSLSVALYLLSRLFAHTMADGQIEKNVYTRY